MILLMLLLLVVLSGQVFAGKIVSINFIENPNNQVFSGGQFIGPLGTNSAFWNSSANATTGDKVSGTLVNLTDDRGLPTGIDAAWQSSTTWYNGDGISDDQHKLAVGYLDDGDSGSGKGATVTLTNIPYANYSIYGLYTSGQGDTSMVNFDVNGSWSLGGDATTTADVYGSINSCNTTTGQYWTQIEQGVTRGNYWVVDTTGATCTITGELKNGTTRGSLTGIILVTGEPAQPMRSISTNFQWDGGPGGWGYHWYVSNSSNPGAGYYTTEDPNEANNYLEIGQAPSATWNEGTFITNTYRAKDETGALGSAIAVHSGDFKWGTSWYENIDNFFAGSDIELYGTAWQLEDAKNKGRIATGFIGHNGGEPKKPLTTMKKVPYGDYMVVVYMHPNRTDDQQEIQIEDQSFFYLNQNGRTGFTESLKDPCEPGWLLATETTGPATETANLAIFRHLSETDMVLIFDTTTNSGISGYELISEVDADDIVTQITPGNVDKDYGDTPAPITTDLTWNAPVNGADSYDVYLGEYGSLDPNLYLVESGNTTGSYAPTLEYNKTYVWRIDTVIGAETITGDYFYFDTEGDPLIQIQPRSVSVEQGSDTFFDVGALLTDNYAWYCSDDAVTDTPGDDVLLQSGPDAQLDIEDVQVDDVKYYYVVLTNTIPDSAAVASDVASLEIGKLELYLPFEGDPNDLSGNYFDVIQNGAGTIGYGTGYDGVGQAASFTRGNDDELNIVGSEDYFNFYPKGLTVRMWVKPTYGVGGFMTMAAKGYYGWHMFDTAEYYGQGFEARINDAYGINTPPGRLDDGNWHMLAMTYDGATMEMKVYQEGFLQGTVVNPVALPPASQYPQEVVSIGSHWSWGGWEYNGLIDEVEIFSYPITELAMLEDYAAKTGEVYCLEDIPGDVDDDCKVGMSDLTIVTDEWLDSTNPETATPAGLVSRVVSWQFDETSGSVATDSSGNGIDGTLGAGFTTGQWIVDGGRTGTTGDNALYFNGDPNTSVIATVADPCSLPTGDVFKGTAAWTMNIWVKYATANAASAMTNIGGFGRNEWLDPSTNSDRYFASYSGGYEFEVGQDGLWPSNPLGTEWQMMTATYDGTTCTVYYNGVQVSQTDVVLVDTLVNEINLNTARRVLWSGVDATVPMNGHVDDFSIWGEAFTAEQVAGMYTNSFPSCDGAIDSDLNGDCNVGMKDFAIMAADWLRCELVPTSLCD